MKYISLDIDGALGAVSREQVESLRPAVEKSMEMLHRRTGRGSDFLGWLHLPSSVKEWDLRALESAAAQLRETCSTVVVIGTGGSYLGSKAVVEALNHGFDLLRRNREHPVVLYAGYHIGEDCLAELCEVLEGATFGIINISKSGTTTEPAIAFRVLKKLLEKNIGVMPAATRIVAVTDQTRGALRTLAGREGYRTFVIPDDVGGRFSVLTPAGLLPIAVAGGDIRQLVQGAADMERATGADVSFDENPASRYAAVRNALYAAGKKVEILANFHPKMHYVGEWWKQLFGESEGKDGRGIFPASADFTADLHSLGQWIQEGERSIFETVLSIETPERRFTVPADETDFDGLNYLAGRRMDEINKMAELATRLAHVDGGVPNVKISLPALDAYYLGQLFYFFEKACALSGYVLGVNPFDQPGVEAYKRNMFALLDKPGCEKESAAIKAKLQAAADAPGGRSSFNP
jgi:glucose-6-phosphate isomerase